MALQEKAPILSHFASFYPGTLVSTPPTCPDMAYVVISETSATIPSRRTLR